MEMTNFTAVGVVLRKNYLSCNLIGLYRFWVISPRNSTSFTRLFLAGRCARAGHEARSCQRLNPGLLVGEGSHQCIIHRARRAEKMLFAYCIDEEDWYTQVIGRKGMGVRVAGIPVATILVLAKPHCHGYSW